MTCRFDISSLRLNPSWCRIFICFTTYCQHLRLCEDTVDFPDSPEPIISFLHVNCQNTEQKDLDFFSQSLIIIFQSSIDFMRSLPCFGVFIIWGGKTWTHFLTLMATSSRRQWSIVSEFESTHFSRHRNPKGWQVENQSINENRRPLIRTKRRRVGCTRYRTGGCDYDTTRKVVRKCS